MLNFRSPGHLALSLPTCRTCPWTKRPQPHLFNSWCFFCVLFFAPFFCPILWPLDLLQAIATRPIFGCPAGLCVFFILLEDTRFRVVESKAKRISRSLGIPPYFDTCQYPFQVGKWLYVSDVSNGFLLFPFRTGNVLAAGEHAESEPCH